MGKGNRADAGTTAGPPVVNAGADDTDAGADDSRRAGTQATSRLPSILRITEHFIFTGQLGLVRQIVKLRIDSVKIWISF